MLVQILAQVLRGVLLYSAILSWSAATELVSVLQFYGVVMMSMLLLMMMTTKRRRRNTDGSDRISCLQGTAVFLFPDDRYTQFSVV